MTFRFPFRFRTLRTATAATLAGLLLLGSAPVAANAEPSVSCSTSIRRDGWSTYVAKRCSGLNSSYQYRTKVKCPFLGGTGVNYGGWKRFGSNIESVAKCGFGSSFKSASVQTRWKA